MISVKAKTCCNNPDISAHGFCLAPIRGHLVEEEETRHQPSSSRDTKYFFTVSDSELNEQFNSLVAQSRLLLTTIARLSKGPQMVLLLQANGSLGSYYTSAHSKRKFLPSQLTTSMFYQRQSIKPIIDMSCIQLQLRTQMPHSS